MSESKYRRAQILDRIPLDHHSVIEASAGTGKTFTIEQLVVEILVGAKATIDKILVVTFTEKATSELRARIRATLESAVASQITTGDEPDDRNDRRVLGEAGRQALRDALFAFDRAPIHTIHSFCHRMLTELAFQSGMRFKVEMTDQASAFHEAFRAELREQIAIDESAQRLLNQWLDGHAIEALGKLLYDAHRQHYLDANDPARHAAATEAQRAALDLEARIVDEFLPRIESRLDRLKRERSVLDYDDMLVWLARALEGPHGGALAAALRERYRYALIDEFQDTDDLQWKIFRRIFVEGDSGNVVYLIGDPKQAIYAFRGADVFAYQRACRELRERGVTAVPLDENFRSTQKMIGALNAILRQDADPHLFTGSIRYDHPVKCGRPYLRAVDAASREVKPVTLMKWTAARPVSFERARVAIGRYIARTLQGILSSGPDQLRVTDKSGELKPVRARDIFILTRSNSDSATIGEFLREAQVPFAFYKQEGLFQTHEASDIVDALKGVEEPGARSRRMKAWATPFFAVRFADLPRMSDLPPSHPLLERLYEWKMLADQERFAELFDAMLHRSGLVDRELFLSNSERELTNYLHIFEILLEKAIRRRLGLAELIALLEDYVAERALPEGEDSDLQRLESERDAVQIMTVHKSKGLEADVVFMFGGAYRGSQSDNVVVFHDGAERRVAIGKTARDAAKTEIADENAEEEQRLIYVAITRARAKLYLPLIPAKSIKKKLDGYYKHLNSRLVALTEEIESEQPLSNLFTIDEVREDGLLAGSEPENSASSLQSWTPPAELLDESHDRDAQKIFASISFRHAPLKICSYTSLQAEREAAASEHQHLRGSDPNAEYFKSDGDAIGQRSETTDLGSGRNVGLFLHEAIEKLDLKSFGDTPDFNSWNARDDVRDLFSSAMRRRGITDPRWLDRGREIVFNALTSRLSLGDTVIENGLYRLSAVREMEFAYPVPELRHPLLGTGSNEAWRVERGYVKGFIDFVFQHDKRIYFADWKGNLMPSYGKAAVEEYVKRHYDLQAAIYSVGIVRLLGIRTASDYSQFGGLLYVFLRGVSPKGDGTQGIYFIRPSWAQIVSYESHLVGSGVDFSVSL